MKSAKCQTLKEYRETVLELPQAEVARRAKCQQAWVSFVERGHLPRAWNREGLLKAYELEKRPEEFKRLVLNAKKVEALQKPMSETEPLLAASNARVVKAVLNDGWEDLTASEITLLATYRQMKAKQA